jgi:hypothetical protein
MKNIHLIATDKPTGIFQSNSGLQFSIRDKVRVEPLKGFHIYITSNEDIKEGAWRCDIELNRIEKGKETGTFKNWKKIILTTDQDLIKDDVRAIGDDFLEWFVKNPSCEFVEIERLEDGKYIDRFADGTIKEGIYENYKIIIPKEEPKQDTVGKEFYESADKTITVYRQETLEEAAERIYPVVIKPILDVYDDGVSNQIGEEDINKDSRESFIAGAKWQQEQDKKMYNEEDMIEFAVWMYLEVGQNSGKERTNKELFKEWFEQFKKEIKE